MTNGGRIDSTGRFVIRHSEFVIQELVSVAGLAPARPGLKNRLRELLCIDGEIGCDGWREFRRRSIGLAEGRSRAILNPQTL
jgi:hypothetical protein